MRLPHKQTTKDIDFAIIGVPSDAGASFRTGQREGPAAIRKVSALLRHHNPILNVSPFEHLFQDTSKIVTRKLKKIFYQL